MDERKRTVEMTFLLKLWSLLTVDGKLGQRQRKSCLCAAMQTDVQSVGSRPKPNLRRRGSALVRHEKREFFRKFSPLSSSAMLLGSEVPPRSGDQSKPFLLDPTGSKAYYWHGLVSLAFVYFAWTIAVRFSFPGVLRWAPWPLLDALFNVVYLLDVAAQMRTSFLCEGILQEDLWKLYEHYTRTWTFNLDALAALPLDWLYTCVTWQQPPAALHVFKLLKVYRLFEFSERTESHSHYPNACRVLFLLHNLGVLIHWNACAYFLLSNWIGLGSDEWVYPAVAGHVNASEWGRLSRQYVYCFYWSTLTLTTIGELPKPETNLEYVVVTFDYLVGILMFATLVGNVGSIIANSAKNRTKFQTKMDQMKHYMKNTHVPRHLQGRVIKWFDYLWNHGYQVDEHHALNALPDKLKAEIGMHVHFETLKKVDFFEECEQGALWEIVVRMRTQVFSPGEFVCRKGEVGREMYIVTSGRLEVLGEEDGVVVRELSHGEYFGEISILNLGQSHHCRTAYVRSVGYTHLLCLQQNDLFQVLRDYPKTLHVLEEKGRRKLGMREGEGEEEGEGRVQNSPVGSVSDSDDSSPCSSPPLVLKSVADEIIDVNIRLIQMESALRELTVALRVSSRTQLHTIQEVAHKRKVSSEF